MSGPTQEEIDEAIGYIGVGLGDNEAAYAEEHRCAEIMVAAYKALKAARIHTEAQESEGFALVAPTAEELAFEDALNFAEGKKGPKGEDDDTDYFAILARGIRRLRALLAQSPTPSGEEIALKISAYLHRLPNNQAGNEVGMMEVGYDEHGQLKYGPFWLSQAQTNDICRAALGQSEATP